MHPSFNLETRRKTYETCKRQVRARPVLLVHRARESAVEAHVWPSPIRRRMDELARVRYPAFKHLADTRITSSFYTAGYLTEATTGQTRPSNRNGTAQRLELGAESPHHYITQPSQSIRSSERQDRGR